MTDVKKLLNARNTVIEMLRDRKYNVSQYSKTITEDECLNAYTKDYMSMTFLNEHTGNKMLVMFYEHNKNNKIGVDIVKRLEEIYVEVEKTNMILVISEKMSYKAEQIFMSQKDVETEVFYLNKLQYNIMKHVFQPQFRLLNEKEKNTLFKKFKKKIPHIKNTDPVCRYYNTTIGDVFEIIRRDNTIYYRLVVA